jgi:Protein of unknown function (DUF4235)
MSKLLYKTVGLLVSVLGGMLAAAIFKKVWKLAAGEDEAPQPTDAGRSWGEILTSAALQGAIFAVVRAAVERATATGTQKLTGTWPGDEGKDEREKREQEKKAGK